MYEISTTSVQIQFKFQETIYVITFTLVEEIHSHSSLKEAEVSKRDTSVIKQTITRYFCPLGGPSSGVIKEWNGCWYLVQICMSSKVANMYDKACVAPLSFIVPAPVFFSKEGPTKRDEILSVYVYLKLISTSYRSVYNCFISFCQIELLRVILFFS